MLRESISGCVFRIATANLMLTNAFWNSYLEPAQSSGRPSWSPARPPVRPRSPAEKASPEPA